MPDIVITEFMDEAAVIDALAAGRLGGAAFKGLGNMVLTSHVAGITDEANERTGTITAANVRNVLEQSK